MKKYFVGIILVKATLALAACVTTKQHFQNKILVYSSQDPENTWKMSNVEFIDFYKDTVNKIGYSFKLFENETKLADAKRKPTDNPFLLLNLYPTSNVPYKLTRKGNSIYLSFSLKDRIYHRKAFELSLVDSVKSVDLEHLCNENSSSAWTITRLINSDTSLIISGKKVRCWVFYEKYPYLHPPTQREQVIYIEKKMLLPVQVRSTFFYTNYQKNAPPILDTSTVVVKIDSVFSRPWTSVTKKWNYNLCWR